MKFQKKPEHEKTAYAVFSHYSHAVREKHELIDYFESVKPPKQSRTAFARDICDYLNSFQRERRRIKPNSKLNLRNLDEEHDRLRQRYEALFNN